MAPKYIMKNRYSAIQPFFIFSNCNNFIRSELCSSYKSGYNKIPACSGDGTLARSTINSTIHLFAKGFMLLSTIKNLLKFVSRNYVNLIVSAR